MVLARLWGAWLTIVGGMMLLSNSALSSDWQLQLDLLRWSLASLVLCEGVRLLWLGCTVARIEPEGLHVERPGAARDLTVQLSSPTTPLSWLAARVPRTAFLLGFAFLLQIFVLRHELRAWLAHIPSYLLVETPHLFGWLAEALMMLAVALVPGALVYACLRIVWSAPSVRGFMAVVFFLLLVPSTVPLVDGLLSGVSLFERANLCFGAEEQPVQAELIAADAMRFTREGESIDYQAPNRRGVKQTRRMNELRPHLDSLVEIRGLLGGRYITVVGARAHACAPPAQLSQWRTRLVGLLENR